jgi:hypothetical protein
VLSAERGCGGSSAATPRGRFFDPQVEGTNEGSLNFFLGENPVAANARAGSGPFARAQTDAGGEAREAWCAVRCRWQALEARARGADGPLGGAEAQWATRKTAFKAVRARADV